MRLLIAALLLVHGAAMGQTFACQYTESTGFHWENGRWRRAGFNIQPPFFLKMNGSNLDQRAVASVFESNGESAKLVRCEKLQIGLGDLHSCMDQFGQFLVYDAHTRKGGKATLGGSTSTDKPYRDSTSVSHFTCQQM